MKYLLLVTLICASAQGHTIFQELYVNGVDQGHLTGIRVPDYDGPITDVTSNDIICNGGINPYHTPLPNTTITVAAGAQVTAEWHHTLDGADSSDPSDPIDPSHHGPVVSYLAQIPNAQQSDVTGLKWFKIYEDGLIAANQSWGRKVTFTIPPCIAAGQYPPSPRDDRWVHSTCAVTYPGAQFYMECAQLKITGGGSTSPATVSFPGAYAGTDPGITVNIYYPLLTNYTIPGPPVFSCSGGGVSTATSKTTTVGATTTPVTSKTTTTTSTASTTTAPAGGTVSQYGQCGGSSYTGPTTCVSPFKCVFSSQFVGSIIFVPRCT
ncbi:glycosyl hydrolase family 61-domain-containing protein [Mycena alexandri]|uniref:AA9 family lytic polysaccharide monooxygenase n=1 Tax=Mycena alexandri TaxID=1745969 RepID=A0AAD6T4L6_9AGAR|nr:glycosyl hydrolase family 61-domain-containing protein [Mycena alexandri]